MRVAQFFPRSICPTREPAFSTEERHTRKQEMGEKQRCFPRNSSENGRERSVHRRGHFCTVASSYLRALPAPTRDQIRWPTILHVDPVSVHVYAGAGWLLSGYRIFGFRVACMRNTLSTSTLWPNILKYLDYTRGKDSSLVEFDRD